MLAPRRSYYEEWRVDLPDGELGSVKVEKFTVTADDLMVTNLHMALSPGGARRMIAPGTYTRIMRNGRLWMSDTDAEVSDHLAFYYEVKRRGGRVLINGLGIGMILNAILKLDNVTHVDVVEIDPDVAELVGSHYAKDPRVHIHVADAHTITWPAGTRWTAAWHDIWEHITLDDNDSRARLKRMYGRRVDVQLGWADPEIAQLKREESRWAGW